MPKRVWRMADRWVQRYGPWLCYVGLAVVFGLGLLSADRTRRDACERFRGDDLPVFVDEWGTNFGEELLGEPQPDGSYLLTTEESQRVARFNARNLADLRRVLPVDEC